jgi:Flp pilus assembly CpaF family ATPase
VPLDRLVYTALRKKPDYIVIGEVRGPEAVGAIEAMETDHSTLVTIHAGGPHDVVNRLMEKYLTYVSGMNVTMALQKIARSVNFVIQKASNKRIGRKIVAITELGYDYRNHDVTVNPIFRYDFKAGRFRRVGAISERMQEKFLTKGADPAAVERFGRLPMC